MLQRSAIPRELADAAMLRRLEHLEARDIYQQRRNGDCSGVWFAYIWPEEPDKLRPSRLRLDHPAGKTKYLAEVEGGNRFYVPPGTPAAALRDISLPVAIVEGEKKCLSLHVLAHYGVERPRWLCLGLSGVDAWRDRRAKTTTAKGHRIAADSMPIADFDGVAWAGRVVLIIFDSNTLSSKHVRAAREALKQHLIGRGAVVEFVDLPEVEGVNGVDDLHYLWGPQATLEYIEQARQRKTSAWGAFRLREEGVYFAPSDADQDPVLICGPLEITAATRSASSENWGRRLEWRDSDGQPHRWAMPISLLGGSGEEYRRRLLDGGLYVALGAKARDKLGLYIQTTVPARRVTCVDRIGWHAESFVLPDECIRGAGAELIQYQSDSESEFRLRTSGSSQEWREQVGRLCAGNSRLVLAVSCAFAGPLLDVVGAEGGGVNVVGPTSTGKTTTLMVAGSVLGGGDDKRGYLQTWRATTNGLEAIAEAHNDLTLILDELSQVDAREAADVAYLLANGVGKTRMTRSIGLRRRLGWRLLYLSAGEITLADHAATAAKRTRGGAEVRLLNISADAGKGMGLLEELHGERSPEAFVRRIRAAALACYGSPLRAYLHALVEHRAEIERGWPSKRDKFVAPYAAGGSGEAIRAAERLAIIGMAGEIATAWGLTGWAAGEATRAVSDAMRDWLANRGTVGRSDDETALRQVRRFVEAHGASRFERARPRVDAQGEPIPERILNRAGFLAEGESGEVEYWVLPETFKGEVCAGLDYRAVARALDAAGCLHREPPDLTRKVRVAALDRTLRVYAIRASILES